MAAPMKLKQAELSNIGLIKDLVESPGWAAQQKMDGIRILFELNMSTDSVAMWNSSGAMLKSSTALKAVGPVLNVMKTVTTRWGKTQTGTYWLDGELLPATGEFWVFDCVIDGGVSTRYQDRQGSANTLVSSIHTLGPLLPIPSYELVKTLPLYTDPLEKIQLVNRVLGAGAEGVVFKRLDKPYDQGRRVDHQLKAKAWRSVDVVAGKPGATGKNSVELFLNDDHGLAVPVGAATLNGREHLMIREGDVLEVKYLYATASHQLYGPPDIMRKRDDKPAHECGLGQLVYTTREVIKL